MSSKNSVLIYVVEDNKVYNRLVCEQLANKNFTNVKSFESGEECIKAVKSGDKPDIVIQDYYLDDINGIEVLQAVKKLHEDAEFIFLTANDNLEIAVNSMKYGAYDYIVKDNDLALKKVIDKVNKILKDIMLDRKNKMLKTAMIITVSVLVAIVVLALLQVFFNIFGKF